MVRVLPEQKDYLHTLWVVFLIHFRNVKLYANITISHYKCRHVAKISPALLPLLDKGRENEERCGEAANNGQAGNY